MPLFEVAILEKPKKSAAKDGALETLIFGPKTIVAADEQAAALSTVMDNADLKIDRARMEVIVRPFA